MNLRDGIGFVGTPSGLMSVAGDRRVYMTRCWPTGEWLATLPDGSTMQERDQSKACAIVRAALSAAPQSADCGYVGVGA